MDFQANDSCVVIELVLKADADAFEVEVKAVLE